MAYPHKAIEYTGISPGGPLVRVRGKAARCIFLLVLAATIMACAGKPEPTEPSDLKGYKEKGIASWYGRKYHGRLTANGERYDMHAMTAAHKRLPFGVLVEVKNLENGKKTRVRINDRGPFKKGRIIDLSYAAARELGMVEQGLARVRIRVVNQR
jgi:rare lipoprotein A